VGLLVRLMSKLIAIITALLTYLLLPVAMVAVAYGVAREYVSHCMEEFL
jgi:hypothetical protein